MEKEIKYINFESGRIMYTHFSSRKDQIEWNQSFIEAENTAILPLPYPSLYSMGRYSYETLALDRGSRQ